MREKPEGIDESELRDVLTEWGIDAVELTYAPVGFGDYHWIAADAEEGKWFITVADLSDKPYCGAGSDAAFVGWSKAMDTAAALRSQGLEFVLAPLPTRGGDTVHRHGFSLGIGVFPFLDGTAGQFSEPLSTYERDLLIEHLAALHRAAPPVSTPVHVPQLSTRAQLERVLGELDQPWRSGPFAEPTRDLLREVEATFRDRLAEFDRRIAALGGRSVVVTHGEPHPGNVVRRRERRLLVDWDTVGLAVPERDLWWVAQEPGDLVRYAELSGHRPDPAALALYRLRWDLDDVSVYVGAFRSAHQESADTQRAWTGLRPTMERVIG